MVGGGGEGRKRGTDGKGGDIRKEGRRKKGRRGRQQGMTGEKLIEGGGLKSEMD